MVKKVMKHIVENDI